MLETIWLKDNSAAAILPAECLTNEFGVIIGMSNVREWYPRHWMEEAFKSAEGRAALGRGMLYPAWEALPIEAQADVLLVIYDNISFPSDWSLGGRVLTPGVGEDDGSLCEAACAARLFGAMRRGDGARIWDAYADSEIKRLCEKIRDATDGSASSERGARESLWEDLTDLVDCEYFSAATVKWILNAGWPALPREREAKAPWRRFYSSVSSEDVIDRMRDRKLDIPSDPAELRDIMNRAQKWLDQGKSAESAYDDLESFLDELERGERAVEEFMLSHPDAGDQIRTAPVPD